MQHFVCQIVITSASD